MRAVQESTLGIAGPCLKGPTKRMMEIGDAARAAGELRELMGSGRRLDICEKSGSSLGCGSAVLKCWGLFCDLSRIPHFPRPELAVLRWSSFFLVGRTFRMCSAHLLEGCKLRGRSVTSRVTEGVEAVAKRLRKSTDSSSSTRTAISNR